MYWFIQLPVYDYKKLRLQALDFPKSWHARFNIDYQIPTGRTIVRHAHTNPSRILQNLYPEGESVCHNVMVHPPGGLVGGDTLDVAISVATGAHGLVTTPGATRFYRSDGELALQRAHISLAENSRFNGCHLKPLLSAVARPKIT